MSRTKRIPQAYQQLGRTAAGALAESGGDLLGGVGPLTAGPLGHQLLQGGTVPRERWLEGGKAGIHIKNASLILSKMIAWFRTCLMPMPIESEGQVSFWCWQRC